MVDWIPSTLALPQEVFRGVYGGVGGIRGPVEEERFLGLRLTLYEVEAFLQWRPPKTNQGILVLNVSYFLPSKFYLHTVATKKSHLSKFCFKVL